MKYFLGLLTVFIFSVIQVVFLPLNFVLMIVYIMSFSLGEGSALFFSFVSGLIFDLVSQSRLGVTSLAFLGISLLLVLYRHRFSFLNPLVIFSFFFIGYLLFSFITGREANPVELVILSIFILTIRLVRPDFFDLPKNQIKL